MDPELQSADGSCNARCSRDVSEEDAPESETSLSAQGACALPQSSPTSDETLLKSRELVNSMDDLASSSNIGIGTSHTVTYASVTGYQSPPQNVILPGQLGDTSQDISLQKSVHHHAGYRTPASSFGAPLAATGPTSQNITGFSPESAVPPPRLPLNILPSMAQICRNNTQVPTGMAEEQQDSIIYPSASPLDCSYNPFGLNTVNSRPAESPSTEDNAAARNIHVNAAQMSWMSARPMSGEANPVPAASPQLNHSISNSSLKSEIGSNCPVRKLPKGILELLNIELGNSEDNGSWEDLLDRYGYNYQEIQRFAKKNARKDIFKAILKEPSFQTYTLMKLQADLQELPRLDLLDDLNEAIAKHNSEAQGSL